MARITRSEQRRRDYVKLQTSLAMQALRSAQEHMAAAKVAVDQPGGDTADYSGLVAGLIHSRKSLNALVRINKDDPFVTEQERQDAGAI